MYICTPRFATHHLGTLSISLFLRPTSYLIVSPWSSGVHHSCLIFASFFFPLLLYLLFQQSVLRSSRWLNLAERFTIVAVIIVLPLHPPNSRHTTTLLLHIPITSQFSLAQFSIDSYLEAEWHLLLRLRTLSEMLPSLE